MGKITDINDLMAKFNARHKDKPEGEAPPSAPAPAPPAADGSEGTPDNVDVNVEDVHVGFVVSMDANGVNLLPLKPNMNMELAEAALTVAMRRVQSLRQQQELRQVILNMAGQRPSGLITPPTA